jgi:signal transduction histidine kinase/DNA-binding response OmpR family regulator
MTNKTPSEISSAAISAALLESEGYAAFEHLGDGAFQVVGAPSRFSAQLLGDSAAAGVPLRLAEQMPFLESFLPDAEECWRAEADGRVESGTWIERGEGGRELALQASALRLGGKRILLIRNPQNQFEGESELLQKARESALGHERLLREIQKKEILLHCVIHDLSQPLSAMRGCFSLLAAENLSPKLRELVEIGQRQTRNQEEMIRGVLEAFAAELAAQDAVGRDTATAPDLAKCARQVAQDFSAAFVARGARIEFDAQVDREGGWRVVGDESRLRRIYTNLVENALRYSDAGSTVTLGVVDEQRFLRAYVDDEGPGLPTGDGAPRLFALFGKGKGSAGKAGLGLYFCKMTVERWGGSIGAENRLGRGTRFWFRLPRAEGRTAETIPPGSLPAVGFATAAQKPRSGRRLRILLADDTPVNRQITGLLLEKQGHDVVAVENGVEALSRFEKQRFDAVILDEEMPEMGGLEAVREIRNREAATGRHIPAILVTGNGTDAARQRSREAGVDAHIAKPFQDEELFQAVEDLCGVEHVTRAPAPSQKIGASALQFDEQELLKRVGGSAKMMRDLAKIFVEDTPKRMTAIRKAIAREDGATLASAAHALRGSVAMLGAVDIADEIRKVETLGREGSVGGASEILASFESKLSAFEKRIAGIAGETARRPKHSRRGGGTKARRRRR